MSNAVSRCDQSMESVIVGSIGSSGCDQWVGPVVVVIRCGQWVVEILLPHDYVFPLLSLFFLAAASLLSNTFL